MRRLALSIILLALANQATATTYTPTALQTTYVDLTYRENHSRWNYSELLYYKGITLLLDRTISKMSLSDKLKGKRLKLRIDSPVFDGGIVFSTDQNDDELIIQARGRQKPRLFLRALLYFTSPEWQPFPRAQLSPDSDLSDELVLQEIDKIFSDAGAEIDSAWAENEEFLLLKLGELRIVFKNGTLSYQLGGVQLKEKVRDPIPIRVGERYLLGTEHGIRVYESGKRIAEKAWSRADATAPIYPLLYVDGKNVDFFDSFGAFLVYSAETNAFYEIQREGANRWPKGRSSPDCDRQELRLICPIHALRRIGFFYLPS